MANFLQGAVTLNPNKYFAGMQYSGANATVTVSKFFVTAVTAGVSTLPGRLVVRSSATQATLPTTGALIGSIVGVVMDKKLNQNAPIQYAQGYNYSQGDDMSVISFGTIAVQTIGTLDPLAGALYMINNDNGVTAGADIGKLSNTLPGGYTGTLVGGTSFNGSFTVPAVTVTDSEAGLALVTVSFN